MAGTMTEADLVEDLKASLQDARTVFTGAGDADFKRQLRAAALDFGRKRRRTLYDALALVADQAAYAAPASFLQFKSSLWGISPRPMPQPWEATYCGPLPNVHLSEEAGVKKLRFDRPPTSAQIAVLGPEYGYYYFAGHAIAAAAANTTILEGERALLLLRAQAEACRELAVRNIHKPVSMRDGLSGIARNSTPSYMYEQLMREFEAA